MHDIKLPCHVRAAVDAQAPVSIPNPSSLANAPAPAFLPAHGVPAPGPGPAQAPQAPALPPAQARVHSGINSLFCKQAPN